MSSGTEAAPRPGARQSDPGAGAPQPDAALLARFERDSAGAWVVFLERYTPFILAELRRLGFAPEPAMDGFVYVCERLAEDGCRRLRSVRELGNQGELVPWLRTVVRNLALNWIDARDGRKRLLKSVAALPPRTQRVFQLTFWRGYKPSEVVEELRRSGDPVSPAAVFDALEELFSVLSQTRLWHLVSALARSRGELSLDAPAEDDGPPLDPATTDPDPEAQLLRKQEATELERALEAVSSGDRLLLQLRYEDALPVAEIAAMMGLGARECERRLAAARQTLRLELTAGRETAGRATALARQGN